MNLLGGIEFCDLELYFWNEGTLFSKKSSKSQNLNLAEMSYGRLFSLFLRNNSSF